MSLDDPSRFALTREALEAPEGARRQAAATAGLFAAIGERLRAAPPRLVVTCARGSSDHAAHYGKYLIETRLGLPVASVGPSVASLYRTPLKLDGALFVAVSQSGRSPDLLSLVEAAKAGGATTLAFVNTEDSPLARLCDHTVPLSAGPERSIAASKSYILSCRAFLALAAAWSGSAELRQALDALPGALEAATELDWWPALAPLATATGLYVLGRGIGLGAAYEAALKFKETCGLHAEAFSSAEVVHGPLGLVGPDFPVIAFGQEDAAAAATLETVARIVGLGAPVASVLAAPGTVRLPTVPGVAPVIAPLCEIESFYLAIARLAAARGRNPDVSSTLRKVTETL